MVPRPWKTFWMHVPGVMISLNVGPEIPIETHLICFRENPEHAIMVSDEVTRILERRFAEQFAESRKTHSYLAKKTKRPSRDHRYSLAERKAYAPTMGRQLSSAGCATKEHRAICFG